MVQRSGFPVIDPYSPSSIIIPHKFLFRLIWSFFWPAAGLNPEPGYTIQMFLLTRISKKKQNYSYGDLVYQKIFHPRLTPNVFDLTFYRLLVEILFFLDYIIVVKPVFNIGFSRSN